MRKLLLLSLLACAACTTRADAPAASQAAQPAPSVPAPSVPAAAAPAQPETFTQIKNLIGKAECSSDSQCQILPVGARPCGGPASYLAWSSARTSSGELQALADRYRTEQQERNARSGMMSDCRAIAPPAVACRAGSCQLGDALEAR